MNEQDLRPGRWLYGLAAVIFVAGWVLFAVFLWKNLSTIGKGFQQVVVPGKTDITLAKPGKYTIFHEYRSVVGTRVFSGERYVSGLECRLASKATGEEVRLSRSLTSATYNSGGRSGVSMLDFRIETPGVYEFWAGYEDTGEGPQVVLAIGQGFGLRIVTTVLGSLAIVFGCIGLAVFIAVYTAVKRHNAQKRAPDRHAI
jgi:hypothetical protein